MQTLSTQYEQDVASPAAVDHVHDPAEASDALRAAMRQVAAPVALVTAGGHGMVRGITVSSLTSVSLAPPMVSFNVVRRTRMARLLAATDAFAVHLLTADQLALSTRFALPGQSGAQQFEGVAYHLDAWGVPLLAEPPQVLRCRRHACHPAGDHLIVVGTVAQVLGRPPTSSLLYRDGGYHALGARLPVPDAASPPPGR